MSGPTKYPEGSVVRHIDCLRLMGIKGVQIEVVTTPDGRIYVDGDEVELAVRKDGTWRFPNQKHKATE